MAKDREVGRGRGRYNGWLMRWKVNGGRTEGYTVGEMQGLAIGDTIFSLRDIVPPAHTSTKPSIPRTAA